MARASYVDARVVDLFEDGITIERALRHPGEGEGTGPATHGAAERAVLRMLVGSPAARDRALRRG